MASYPTRTTASFAAIAPVPSLDPLDDEFDQYVGAAGIFNGGSTGTKLKTRASDASDPVYEFDQLGAGPIIVGKQNGSEIFSIEGDGTAPGLDADKVDGHDAADFPLIATAKVHFSISWFIEDPSAFGTGTTASLPVFVCPDGGQVTLTKSKVLFNSGSHTNGTGLEFVFNRFGVGNFGTLQLNDTNNTVNTLYTNDFVNIDLSANDVVGLLLNARTGSVTERSVTLILFGYRLISAS
jgi:hypothetical protein